MSWLPIYLVPHRANLKVESRFFFKFWKFMAAQDEKYNFMWNEIQPMWGQIAHWKTRKLRKVKIWNFSMFSSIWPDVGWISPHTKSSFVNPCEVRLTQVRFNEPPKWNFFIPWFLFGSNFIGNQLDDGITFIPLLHGLNEDKDFLGW